MSFVLVMLGVTSYNFSPSLLPLMSVVYRKILMLSTNRLVRLSTCGFVLVWLAEHYRITSTVSSDTYAD